MQSAYRTCIISKSTLSVGIANTNTDVELVSWVGIPREWIVDPDTQFLIYFTSAPTEVGMALDQPMCTSSLQLLSVLTPKSLFMNITTGVPE